MGGLALCSHGLWVKGYLERNCAEKMQIKQSKTPDEFRDPFTPRGSEVAVSLKALPGGAHPLLLYVLDAHFLACSRVPGSKSLHSSTWMIFGRIMGFGSLILTRMRPIRRLKTRV